MIKTTHTTTSDTAYHWLPVGPTTPRGTKIQLIDRRAGVARYGSYDPKDQHITHWAPLPTFEKTEPLGPAEEYILNEMLRNTEIKYDPVRGHRI